MDQAANPTAGDTLESGPFVDGFSRHTVLGALFVAVVMMPSTIYLGLVAGQTLGPAAEWVTIILFAELAKRSFARLKRQEIYVLFYVASAIAAVVLAHVALAGGPFAWAIWNQYLLQSPQTSGIATAIPDWVVPPAGSPGIQDRNLAHPDWWFSASHGFLGPLMLIFCGYVLGRLAWFGLGYILFRATSDVERLPFPLAPIAAEGATALAESTERDAQGELRGKASWRWRVFSVGASLGIAFGAVYVLLPIVSGLFMAKPIMLLPIPFADFTSNFESLLPASLISVSFDAGALLAGMILPFNLVLGVCLGIVLTSVFGNPILQHFGLFPHWTPGNGLLVNQMLLNYDLWLSVSLGLAGAVAIVGVGSMIKVFRAGRSAGSPGDSANRPTGDPPYRTASKERGDFPLWIAAGLYLIGTGGLVGIAHVLVPGFPVWIIIIFGFLWSPFHSYISARLVGLTGVGLGIPYLKETVFLASGYKDVDIWFAPVPLLDCGYAAQTFRVMELTRTRLVSIIKAELLTFLIIFISSFLFWWFFWRLNQIPSDSFPYAARTWPVAARQAYLIFTANSGADSLLRQALKPLVIGGSCGIGLLVYGALALAGAPAVFFYGLVGGVAAPAHVGLSLLAGALLGRYYFSRKFGPETWARYVPVAAAGIACGLGLAGMAAVALSLIAHSTRELPF
ncbi:MAG: peptide transporter [Planctomycetota bacterium]